MALLEVCIDNAAGLSACDEGGADRIELCSALALGGLTPSFGLMQLAAQANAPVFVMIRPRAGHFCFTRNELAIMCDDIAAAAEAGLAGVVLGVVCNDLTLDIAALTTLCNAAGNMGKTLHRVIDTVAKPLEALEQVIDLGFDQVLSSGGKASAGLGLDGLAALHDRAQGRIQIMAGAGLTPATVPVINQHTGIDTFHASCKYHEQLGEPYSSLGFATPALTGTDANLIRQYQCVIRALPGRQNAD